MADAVAELRAGRMVLVVDDENRENEGVLLMAAEAVSTQAAAFMVRHTSGLLCVALTGERAQELRLPLMVSDANDPRPTAFTVSVDLKCATSTGISAADRAATTRALADAAARSEELSRPGHVFPLIAREGGVLCRAGHTESAVDLCRLAGLAPAGLLAEVTNPDGSVARRPELGRFAAEHNLITLTVAEIVRYRRRIETLVHRAASGRVPTEHGEFTAIAYRSTIEPVGTEHVALVQGEVNQAGARSDSGQVEPVLARVHSECLTGDVFGSRRCGCRGQLQAAMARISEAGRGVVVYLRGHQGRGTGLSHKLRADTAQNADPDTVDANLGQCLPVDSPQYGVAAQILGDLGLSEIRLMTSNPAKYQGLVGHGIQVAASQPLVISPNPANASRLASKHTGLHRHLDRPRRRPAPACGGQEA